MYQKYRRLVLFLVLGLLGVVPITKGQTLTERLLTNSNMETLKSSKDFLNQRITMHIHGTPMEAVLKKLEKKAGIHFSYREALTADFSSVTLDVTDSNLSEVLDQLFSGSGLDYKAEPGKYVILKKKIVAAQDTVKGVVTDFDSGESLPGVNILVKGTSNGTATNINGEYSLVLPEGADSLVFSYIGYQRSVVPIMGRSVINLKMRSGTLQGQEVVVVGYGEQKRSDVTGSMTTVSSDQIESVPVTDASKALQGKVAGLNITQSEAIPGSSPSIMVRGQNSISANNSPLIIVDGVPFSGGINDINQNDIANISVLKGPSATAIYGTRGSNGVILITTKKGKEGKATIKYSGHTGIGNIAHVLQPSSPQEYLKKYKWYQLETGVPQDQLQPVPNAPGGYEYNNYQNGHTVDWIDAVTRQGYTTDNNLTISGATDKVNYYVSGEYLKQRGAIKGYQFERSNIRSNLDATLTNYLEVGANLFYNANNYDGGQANLLMAAEMSPYGKLRNSQGDYTHWPMYPELLYTNPLLPLYRDRISRYKRLDGKTHAILKPAKLGGGIDFLKGLQYRVNASYSYAPSHNATYTGRKAGSTNNGSADMNYTTDTNWLVENILSYKRDFGKHHIDFTGLYSAQEFKHFWSSESANGFINDLLSYNNLSAGSNKSADSDASSYTLLSQMARLNYSYKNTYLLTLTARRDGYSAFGSNTNKYGLFPTVAVGWNISNEDFMQNIDAVNDLKVRLSYGETGNQAISPNQTVTTDATVLYPFNGLSTVGTVPNVLGNADLQWETSTTTDLGLDFGILRNRIRGSVDLYKTDTKGLLLQRHLPAVTGYSSVWANLGETSNKGLEVTLNTTNINKGDFVWTSDITFATNHNEIVDLYGDKKDDVGNRWFIGQPIHVNYDYTMIGVWQKDEAAEAAKYNAEPGDLKIKDISGPDGTPDGKITSDDRSILGSSDPKWTGGLSNTFRYKNFSLRVFIQTVQGVQKSNQILNWVDLAGRRNLPAGMSYWTPENNNNSMPSLAYTNTIGYGYPRDASYTRLKDVTLSYNLPEKLQNQLGVGDLTLYVSGNNLYTWTPWFGWDPESYYAPRGWGGYETNYPLERQIVFGVNLSL